MKQSKTVSRIAEIQIRLNNGIGLITFIKNSIYIGAGLTIVLKLNVSQSIITTLLALLGFYIIGALDIKYFKLMQEMAKISSGKYNPYFTKKLGK